MQDFPYEALPTSRDNSPSFNFLKNPVKLINLDPSVAVVTRKPVNLGCERNNFTSKSSFKICSICTEGLLGSSCRSQRKGSYYIKDIRNKKTTVAKQCKLFVTQLRLFL